MPKPKLDSTPGGRLLTFGGLSLTLAEWAKRMDLAEGTLRNRINKMGQDLALSTPKRSLSEAGRKGGAKWRAQSRSPWPASNDG